MKKIGITTRISHEKPYDETRDALDHNWIKLLLEIGFLPIIIPTGINYGKYIKRLNIEGIILTGGGDLSSMFNDKLSQIRDKKEKMILEYSIKNSIPVYGVCRGMQFIAEYFGSTLKKVTNHVNISHKIYMKNQFWGATLLKDQILVNSYHNFGIDLLSDELIAIAVSDDNCIEALVHSSHKIFCSMWHPEREKSFNNFDLKLIKKSFIDNQLL